MISLQHSLQHFSFGTAIHGDRVERPVIKKRKDKPEPGADQQRQAKRRFRSDQQARIDKQPNSVTTCIQAVCVCVRSVCFQIVQIYSKKLVFNRLC